MNEYHKIQTVYHRDPATRHKTLLEGQWSLTEFGYLASNRWEWTEKVDGTNIRVVCKDGAVSYGGKTDAAQIPAKLVGRLKERFEANAALRELGADVVLYGEGYGAGIQSGGVYRADQDFILFDARIGGWWLQRDDVADVARKIGCDVVPVVGRGTLLEAIETVRKGLSSVVGQGVAEGLVMRPAVELCTRSGERVIAKIKTRDFAP